MMNVGVEIPTGRADYWKSQGRKFCDFCKCWIADNKPSIEFHESGKKHKENVSKRLREIHKNSAKQAKQHKKFEDDIKKMESAAMAAYLKDVENDTKDMTANKIIEEKLSKIGYSQFPQDIDPCDPISQMKFITQIKASLHRTSGTSGVESVENKSQGKGRLSKGKGKGKKSQEENRPNKVGVQKLWYEALSSEGFTYYWHIETNESIWNPPEEGYMTIAEQEKEVKEHAIQTEFLKQIEEEEAIKKAEHFEEERANAEREKLKELRKRENDQSQDHQVESITAEGIKESELPSYKKECTISRKPQPYGSWQTVQFVAKKPVNLQLPEQKLINIPVPTVQKDTPTDRIFKEKTITSLSMGESDEDEGPTTFKKRKFGNKNVRKRLNDI
ncbi:WW domain-binding protein 4 [Orussus abietinus]|uniref:WW domain-binding protein 4 n=1 Tax=Orussus abietinus TaxID=222816 RepID=UPI000C715BAB|nr:WW domain-binding protein 4 [Orussus abietinus]